MKKQMNSVTSFIAIDWLLLLKESQCNFDSFLISRRVKMKIIEKPLNTIFIISDVTNEICLSPSMKMQI